MHVPGPQPPSWLAPIRYRRVRVPYARRAFLPSHAYEVITQSNKLLGTPVLQKALHRMLRAEEPQPIGCATYLVQTCHCRKVVPYTFAAYGAGYSVLCRSHFIHARQREPTCLLAGERAVAHHLFVTLALDNKSLYASVTYAPRARQCPCHRWHRSAIGRKKSRH